MIEEVLLQEVKRRAYLQLAVDKAIDSLVLFKDGCHARTRKGTVQTLVAQELGITLNSNFRALINKRMKARGFRELCVHGLKYYRNALIKEGHKWEEKTF